MLAKKVFMEVKFMNKLNCLIGIILFLIESIASAGPLHDCVKSGNLFNIEQILSKESSQINSKDQQGWMPLHLAASMGRSDIIKLLIDNRADVNASGGPSGNTPLHAAVVQGNEDAVRLLIDRGAGVNIRDIGGFTPLHGASSMGKNQIVQILLQRGADPKIPTNSGETPLKIAEKKGNESLCQILKSSMREGSEVNPDRFIAIEGNSVVIYSNPVSFSGNGEKPKPVVIERLPRVITLQASQTQEETINNILVRASTLADKAKLFYDAFRASSSSISGSLYIFGIDAAGLGSICLGYTEKNGIGFYWYPQDFGWQLWNMHPMNRIEYLTGIAAVKTPEDLAAFQNYKSRSPQLMRNPGSPVAF
jgi:hypothetical protein